MLVGIGCIAVFILMAFLMSTRRLTALLALPLMAVALAFIGGVPGRDILEEVLAKGAVKLNATYTTTMFGAMLAELLNRLGIAKSLIRWVAEFAGEEPYILGIVIVLVTALLFSTLGGLGAVIMVGTIILPVLLSIGISQATAGALFLFGINLGGMFNIANWQLYMDVLSIPRDQIISFVLPFGIIVTSLIAAFLALELKQAKNIGYAVAAIALTIVAFMLLQSGMHGDAQSAAAHISGRSITISFLCLIALSIYAIYRQSTGADMNPGFVLLTPIVPLVFVLLLHWDFIPAFMAGIAFATLSTWKKDSLNTLNRSIIDGITSVIPAVVLMIGIGMLINAVKHPKVSAAIAPFLSQIIPTVAWQYVLVFSLVAPLSLYRGPLSLWGMGSGIVSLIQKATTLSSQAIMGMVMSVGQVQGICDPTNTHNIWIATYLSTDTQTLLRKTFPYAWIAVVAGLTLSIGLGYVR
jgi:Na+/H+ antiporter NhaD/arsenite permease-like protein